jgi:hypothetical protein
MTAIPVSQVLPGNPTEVTGSMDNKIDPWGFAAVLYLGGFLFLLLRFSHQFWSLQSIFNKSKVKRTEKGIRYIETHRDIAPFSFFRTIVYNPNLYHTEELEAILAHEKAHCDQKHSLDILISQIMTIILWINPISFLYRNTVRQNLEFLADASATNVVASKKRYQYTMLKLSGQQLPLPIINQFYNSLIKKRIVMLHKSQSKKISSLKYALVLPALALFLFSFNTKEVYVPTSAASDLNWLAVDNGEKIEVKINKDTSDEELEKIKQDLAKEGVDFSYTVVRNSKKEIIDLSVDMNSNPKEGSRFRGSSNFENEGEPIDPVTIILDPENNFIFMGGERALESEIQKVDDMKMNFFLEEDEDMTEEERERLKKEGVEFIIISEDIKGTPDEDGNIIKKVRVKKENHGDKGHRIMVKRLGDDQKDSDENKFVRKKVIKWTEKDGDTPEGEVHEEHIKIITSDGDKGENVFIMKDSDDDEDIEMIEGEDFFYVDSNSGEKPLYVIDGKVVKDKTLKALSPKDIATVNVLKGDSAIEKYGKKAKDGVIEITTKKN